MNITVIVIYFEYASIVSVEIQGRKIDRAAGTEVTP